MIVVKMGQKISSRISFGLTWLREQRVVLCLTSNTAAPRVASTNVDMLSRSGKYSGPPVPTSVTSILASSARAGTMA